MYIKGIHEHLKWWKSLPEAPVENKYIFAEKSNPALSAWS
jgi:hypothetical protein